MAGLVGYLVLLGSAWALWFHALAGIRHLFYDSGKLLRIEEGLGDAARYAGDLAFPRFSFGS